MPVCYRLRWKENLIMAVIKVTYQSYYLRRNISFCAYIPTNSINRAKENIPEQENGYKTLYLLHGYGGNDTDFLNVPELQEQFQKNQLACIFPSGENTFYLEDIDKGENFSALIGEELVKVTRSMFRLSERREDTYIGGISMGGYGAMINGLRYADTFSKIISLSGAYIEINIADKGDFIPDDISDARYQQRIFGDPRKLKLTDKDPRYCIQQHLKSGIKLPDIYLVCGEDDFLIEPNRKLHDFMARNQVEHYYEEGEGMHDWNYWRRHLAASIQWLSI